MQRFRSSFVCCARHTDEGLVPQNSWNRVKRFQPSMSAFVRWGLQPCVFACMATLVYYILMRRASTFCVESRSLPGKTLLHLHEPPWFTFNSIVCVLVRCDVYILLSGNIGQQHKFNCLMICRTVPHKIPPTHVVSWRNLYFCGGIRKCCDMFSNI